MKLSALLFAAAVAEDKKVPPRHPIQRLRRLNQFASELILMWFDGWLPSSDRWYEKFGRQTDRMILNFERGNQRCGYYDENQLPHGGPERKRRDDDDFDVDRYNRDDPRDGVRQITTGYRKWAERYLSQCSGQKKYQYVVNKMNKWNRLLQEHLAESTLA